MDWSRCKWVESVPERMSGVPVLINSRMPASSVLENFEEGSSADEIAAHYELDAEAVRGALQYARETGSVTAA